ncbi:2Fe-2S iron-sulfur cluster-binding protein [Alteribacillus iranensis]|uniref:Succinate dehydrogenase / fumarate reductase iron-sulfur subunit n=1 Tax=Alteribacillus iranensis TaxID=930128 RepID=A0A1I2EKK5_9BACI|nr:2Fe-2S iron-sulfur cluster-binding protein [Alteribacillus iranensis]SFE93213.1 succinate dehydrogenase / fumarate reductase iron-sulfur subunit [Alteribacillus iranensis]
MCVIRINVKRKTDEINEVVTYLVNTFEERMTLLEALKKIQEKQEPTLGIRYGCRFKDCGLCAVKVNGKEKMACVTNAKNEMLVEPLDHVPIVQDLIVERSYITKMIRDLELIPTVKEGEASILVSDEYMAVVKCTDCQACLSSSDIYSHENRYQNAGPLFFVKLAQIYYHPRLDINYKEIAQKLGLHEYKNSPTIPCPYGVPINKLAISPFID